MTEVASVKVNGVEVGQDVEATPGDEPQEMMSIKDYLAFAQTELDKMADADVPVEGMDWKLRALARSLGEYRTTIDDRTVHGDNLVPVRIVEGIVKQEQQRLTGYKARVARELDRMELLDDMLDAGLEVHFTNHSERNGLTKIIQAFLRTTRLNLNHATQGNPFRQREPISMDDFAPLGSPGGIPF